MYVHINFGLKSTTKYWNVSFEQFIFDQNVEKFGRVFENINLYSILLNNARIMDTYSACVTVFYFLKNSG